MVAIAALASKFILMRFTNFARFIISHSEIMHLPCLYRRRGGGPFIGLPKMSWQQRQFCLFRLGHAWEKFFFRDWRNISPAFGQPCWAEVPTKSPLATLHNLSNMNTACWLINEPVVINGTLFNLICSSPKCEHTYTRNLIFLYQWNFMYPEGRLIPNRTPFTKYVSLDLHSELTSAQHFFINKGNIELGTLNIKEQPGMSIYRYC